MGIGCQSSTGNAKSCRPKIFVSTGSTSSDILMAPVLAELARRRPLGPIAGVGGAPLRDAGAHLFFDTTATSTVGIVASARTLLSHAASAVPAYWKVREYFRNERPDLVILVDNPGHNLRLLSLAHRYAIPVLYYAPPELWSLGWWQVRAVVRKTSVIAPIFESERRVYSERGARVRFIGHPLLDLMDDVPKPPALGTGTLTIGLFPGSRRHEVKDLLPALLGAAEIIQQSEPTAHFVMCAANESTQRLIDAQVPRCGVPVEVVRRQSHSVLSRCNLLLTCSGTATLEAAVLGIPMVVMYRLHYVLDRILQKCILRGREYPYFSLPNYLLNRAVLTELRNDDANPARIASEGLALLSDAQRRFMVSDGLAEVRSLLGSPGAIGRTADLVEELLDDDRSRTNPAAHEPLGVGGRSGPLKPRKRRLGLEPVPLFGNRS
jgi:lipid-A-disaccharide synthase